MEDREYYWDWMKHEDNLFTNRNNLLLVAESMTFAAVATVQAGTAGHSTFGVLLAAAGFFITLIWMFASLKYLVPTDPPLKRKLREIDPIRKDFDHARSNWWSNH